MNAYITALSHLSRNKFIRLTLQQQKKLINVYEDAGRDLVKRYQKLRPETASAALLQDYNHALRAEVSKLIEQGASKSADIPADMQGSFMDKIAAGLNLNFDRLFSRIPNSVVQNIVSGNIYKDGTGLSSRIWQYTAANGRDIQDIITSGLANRRSAVDIAKALETYVRPEAHKEWDAEKMKEILGPDYARWNKRVEYNTLRLARTTWTHSFTLSTIQSSRRNPFVNGLKWVLSPSHDERMHGRRDICDDYAEQDDYGLGAGVFPIDKCPFEHPNGLCDQRPVIPGSTEDIAHELGAWVRGESNPKLDSWYSQYGGDID